MVHQSYQQQQTENSSRGLRTTRQRRRALITDRDKHLLALHRERRSLWQKRRELPWITLDPPIIRGWKRSFVLREDVARSNDAAIYERILEHINTVQYSHRSDFKKKKRSKGRKIHVLRDQHLQRLDLWHWNKCAFTPKEAAHFELVEEPPSGPRGVLTYRYAFCEPWRYVLCIQPNIITKVRQHDEELEAAIKAIDNDLERNHQRGRLDKLLSGGGYKWWRWSGREPKDAHYTDRRPFRNIPLHALTEGLKQED